MAVGKLQPRLNKRRKDFYHAVCTGLPLSKALTLFSEQYGVTEEAIYKDWAQRDQWECVKPVDATNAVQDSLLELEEIRFRLWDKAMNAPKDSDQIKSLRHLADIRFRILELFQSLGLITNLAPQKKMSDEEIDLLHQWVVDIAGENDIENQKNIVRSLMKASHEGRDWRTHANADIEFSE